MVGSGFWPRRREEGHFEVSLQIILANRGDQKLFSFSFLSNSKGDGFPPRPGSSYLKEETLVPPHARSVTVASQAHNHYFFRTISLSTMRRNHSLLTGWRGSSVPLFHSGKKLKRKFASLHKSGGKGSAIASSGKVSAGRGHNLYEESLGGR